MSNTQIPNNSGSFPIRQDITVLPADEKWESENENPLVRLIEDAYEEMFGDKSNCPRLGWVIYERIGGCVINNEGITRVNFGDEDDGILQREYDRSYEE
tara:strand:- start:129 stop:425 length:297 start_codon:yes stop_codon:yes gene_type:complete